MRASAFHTVFFRRVKQNSWRYSAAISNLVASHLGSKGTLPGICRRVGGRTVGLDAGYREAQQWAENARAFHLYASSHERTRSQISFMIEPNAPATRKIRI
jgi:hypothetical protein